MAIKFVGHGSGDPCVMSPITLVSWLAAVPIPHLLGRWIGARLVDSAEDTTTEVTPFPAGAVPAHGRFVKPYSRKLAAAAAWRCGCQGGRKTILVPTRGNRRSAHRLRQVRRHGGSARACSSEIYPTIIRAKGGGLAAGSGKAGGVLVVPLVLLFATETSGRWLAALSADTVPEAVSVGG